MVVRPCTCNPYVSLPQQQRKLVKQVVVEIDLTF